MKAPHPRRSLETETAQKLFSNVPKLAETLDVTTGLP